MRLTKHLILVGLPGAGKTTVGPMVAEALECAFLDIDQEVERQTGTKIPQLFKYTGERGFRLIEREITRGLAGRRSCVVSPGGGWITQPATVALAQPVGCIIYLRVTPATAVARLGEAYRSRPLLGDDPLPAMERLYAERREAYESADEMVDVETLTVQEVTRAVVELARQRYMR